ncbi:hypothetical protein Anas_04902 [Armadillidium nasatum]|uniref:UPAR/Ly6 domain-containing protein n=1 Tax=Armadillidium nasatum TaxID=96803 RepID=A0A5N5SSU7_9CRUS|nr:hypothetical protein Anas_04902 [Armadillidium nasatum]
MGFLNNKIKMLPKYCSISVLCILLMITPLYGLKCYDCEDCLNSKPDIEECEGSENACIKVTAGNMVSKTCINDNFCSMEKFEEGMKKAWNKLTNIFTVTPKNSHFTCCGTDYCNSGNRLGNALGTFAASCFLIGFMYFLN